MSSVTGTAPAMMKLYIIPGPAFSAATEVSTIAVAYALIVGKWLYGKGEGGLTARKVYTMLVEAAGRHEDGYVRFRALVLLSGFNVDTGRFPFVLTVVMATLGSVIGAWVLYGVGAWIRDDRGLFALAAAPAAPGSRSAGS